MPLFIKDSMEPDYTKRSVNSTSALFEQHVCTWCACDPQPFGCRSCVLRLNRASWLTGAVVSSGTLSFYRCNTASH